MTIYLPESFAVEEQLHRTLEFIRGYNKFLQSHDEKLSCEFAKEDATDPRLTPGRWHIRRRNVPDRPDLDSFYAITTPDGGYREPNHWDLDRLRQRDTATRSVADILSFRQEKEEAAERKRALFHEQSRDEIAADWRAARRVAGDGGFTKRAWGKK